MNRRIMYGRCSLSLFMAALWGAGCLPVIYAADVQVQVGNYFFSPRNVTINVNDQVVWTWVAGYHSTTSSLWDSGIKMGGTFSHVFTTVGTFDYRCSVIDHEMYASVTVQGGNTLPTVSITSPTNGAIFAAPATVAFEASAADTDGTISQVQFFTNSAPLLIDSTAPYQATATNLPAGSYNLFAIATDNQSATATSSVVTISVVNPAAIVLSGWRHMSATQFQFRYTANPGLRYVVESSPILTNWSPVATSTASGTLVSFTNDITTNRNFYRVGRLPNP